MSRERELSRMALIIVLAVAVVALVAYARGAPHHRGQEVGALADHAAVARVTR